MDINSKVKEAISYGSKKLGYQSLREVQQKVAIVEAYLGGQDVFVCLPTGSGKSFCFEIAPYAIECMQYGLTAVEKQTAPKTICLVVAPFNSL